MTEAQSPRARSPRAPSPGGDVSPEPFRMTVPLERGALAATRAAVRGVLRDWDCPEEQSSAVVLLMSELVTNAHRHADSCAELELVPYPDRVRLTVTDSSPAPPALREPGVGGGYGMHLVGRLSTDWGVDELAEGKRVWAEIPRDL